MKLSKSRPTLGGGMNTAGFTGLMWFVLVLAAGACVHFTMQLEKIRKLPDDYALQDGLIRESEVMIDDLNSVPVLPPLPQSWKGVNASAELSGVQMEVVENTGDAQYGNTYSGPLKNWMGSLSGPASRVVALTKSLQQEYPMFLYDYTVVGGVMKINFVVVGT